MKLAASLALVILVCAACGESVEPATKQVPVSQGLAQIQNGGPVDPDDPLVAAFTTALKILRPLCRESDEKLADLALATQEVMKKDGNDSSLLDILLGVSAAAGGLEETSAVPTECADFFAVYATLADG